MIIIIITIFFLLYKYNPILVTWCCYFVSIYTYFHKIIIVFFNHVVNTVVLYLISYLSLSRMKHDILHVNGLLIKTNNNNNIYLYIV